MWPSIALALSIMGEPITCTAPRELRRPNVLQHLIAELNRSEIARNGEGRRAYYVYVRQGIHSLDLMKRVAESCGALGMGTVDRILRNLRFDLGQRQVLLVFDEAQHLSIECLETIRELLDQPPHCGLLFAGTHELEAIFTHQALELEQWRSRFHAGQALPGISEEEAATIVHSELGLGLSQRKIHKLISKSRITDLRHGGQHSYVSARRLFWVIRELQTVAAGQPEARSDSFPGAEQPESKVTTSAFCDLRHKVAVWQGLCFKSCLLEGSRIKPTMRKAKKEPLREHRIQNEAIVDAYGPEEQALGWYYYLENQIRVPFAARRIAFKDLRSNRALLLTRSPQPPFNK